MRKHLKHLPRSVRPSVRHTFGFRLWALTKRHDDIVVADMVADMVGDMEVDMVANMEVFKVADMVADTDFSIISFFCISQ